MTSKPAKINISVTILTRNSESHLTEVLESAKAFAEVIILDEQSSDRTLEIAGRFANTRIYPAQKPILNEGFGARHNYATSLASFDWILSLDSDEIISPELNDEIAALPLSEHCVYSMPRENYFNDKRIKSCGWHPDRKIRIYHRQTTRFSDQYVHEKILRDGLQEIRLTHPLKHYSYESIADFINKMQLYSELFAIQHQGSKKSSPVKALSHSLFAFFKHYFLQLGFMDGYEGFLISSCSACGVFYKYLKLYESNRNLR